jgi:hypothetical protein
VVDDAARQRLREGDRRVDRDQTGRLGGLDRGDVDAGRRRGTGQLTSVQVLVGRREQQQPPRRRGQRREPGPVLAPQPAVAGQRRRRRLRAGQLGRRERAGEVDQRERVSPGDRGQLRGEVTGGHDVLDQLDAGVRVERLEAAHRHTGKDRSAPGRGEHGDPFAVEPAGHEAEHVEGAGVQFVGVVDADQQRPPGRGRPERTEHGHRPGEDRLAGRRVDVQLAQQRAEATERPAVGVGGMQRDHDEAGGLGGGHAQDGAAADTRVAGEHAGAAAAGGGTGEQRADAGPFGGPTAKYDFLHWGCINHSHSVTPE